MSSSTELDVDVGARLNKRLRLDEVAFLQVSGRIVDHVDNAVLCCTPKLEPVRYDLIGSYVYGIFGVKVAIQHQEEGAGRRNLAFLSVALRVDYEGPEDLEQDAEAVPHFLGIVGWMTIWPYVRAEVQQLSMKLGFPALTLPLMLTGQTKKVPVVRLESDNSD